MLLCYTLGLSLATKTPNEVYMATVPNHIPEEFGLIASVISTVMHMAGVSLTTSQPWQVKQLAAALQPPTLKVVEVPGYSFIRNKKPFPDGADPVGVVPSGVYLDQYFTTRTVFFVKDPDTWIQEIYAAWQIAASESVRGYMAQAQAMGRNVNA